MIKAILFDLDGVVVDSERLYQRAEETLFARFGVTIPDEDWVLFRGVTENRFYTLARERYKIDISHDDLLAQGRKEVLAIFENELVYRDGFEALHQALIGNYRLALVTSTPNAIFETMDRLLSLREKFEFVLTGDMTAQNKPHPEPYLTAMNHFRIRAEDTVVVEDSVFGITAGFASGAWTVAITGSVDRSLMPERHVTIDHLSELTSELLNDISSNQALAL